MGPLPRAPLTEVLLVRHLLDCLSRKLVHHQNRAHHTDRSDLQERRTVAEAGHGHRAAGHQVQARPLPDHAVRPPELLLDEPARPEDRR